MCNNLLFFIKKGAFPVEMFIQMKDKQCFYMCVYVSKIYHHPLDGF